MKVLNLYAGLGGNRQKWKGVEVTAIEWNEEIRKIYYSQFPDDMVLNIDAHIYLKNHVNEYDFIWSSPPCQSHSRMMKATRHKNIEYFDMQLWQEIILLTHFCKGLWVVENVIPYYEPLIKPNIIIGRHCFWSNFNITPFKYQKMPNLINTTTVAGAEALKEWLNIKYEGNLYTDKNHHPTQALRNCVHPDLGLHILDCARNNIRQKDTKQMQLF